MSIQRFARRSVYTVAMVALFALLEVPVLRAENNVSYVVNGVGTNMSSGTFLNYTAGARSNSLQIINGGSVTNTGASYIGAGNNGGYNSVLVRDGSSIFTNGTGLYIGYANANETNTGNSLTVTNGGVVFSTLASMGNLCYSNRAIVAGSGSKWLLGADMTIGANGGADNQLTVANGGLVVNATGAIGAGTGGNSFSNRVVVTDDGSVWTNSSICYIGASPSGGNGGSDNQLLVTNGGVVYASRVQVGYMSTVVATTNNNNNLTVTGPGSKLVNAGNMYIGQNTNSGNQLLIANSGAVYAAVAYLYGSSRATVSDGGSIWSNSSTLIFDSKPGASQVIVTNGGTLCSAGGTFGQTAALTATGNQVVVTGTGSVWISKGGLSVGNNNFANGNQLVVDSGGAAYFLGTINIGPGTGSSNNLVLVTGVGSVVSNNAAITVGYQGVNNQLIITNGATLTSLSGSIGYNGNASYNTAVVAGGAATSVWNVGGALAVGFGNDTPSTGNVLRVEAGGIVTNVTTVDVGRGRVSTDNSLVIANGGMMRSSGLVNIGNNTAGAGRNTIVVTGAGSTWTNTTGGVTFPSAGVAGIGNNLTIANGGRFVDTGNILVNSFGSTLAVTNGGTLIVAGAYDMSLASTAGGGNTVLVIGNGSRMTGLQNMTVGGTGNGGNKVIVSDGGVMNNSSSGNNYIGYGPGSNNQLIVTGTGSVFSSVSDITLGYNTNTSIGNSVLVTNGGQVILGTPATSKGVAAGRVGSSNNTVLVGSGGLLECYSLSANGGGGSGNSISNIGGVIQFYGVTPTISPGVFGAIGVSNGVVSFRGVTTADVFCNQSTKPLNSTNKMVWSGANGFRLNTATNSAGQNYTFTDTMGPTNFARLELFNGSRYNGNVTIGSGGTLGTSSGTNGSLRISGNLTVSGGTLAMTLGGPDDGVSVTGVVNLANATLQVTLGGDPTSLYPFHLVRAAGGLSGRFGTSLIQASYGGTNYTIGVNYSGTDVVLIQGTKGSIFSIR